MLAVRCGLLTTHPKTPEGGAGRRSKGRNWPISFVTSRDTGQFQGFTNYTDDRRIEINIPPLTSRGYDDSLKAHELTHVILNARGFVGVFFGEFGQYVAPNVADLFDGARLATINS